MEKKARFNIIDLIVIVAIIAALGIAAYKIAGGSVVQNGGAVGTYTMKFLCEEVPDFAADLIAEGDVVVDETKDNPLGTVTNVVKSESRTYTTDKDGGIHVVGKPYYQCVELTTTLEGEEYANGVIVKSSKYGVGHSITIRVGKAKIFGRVSYLEKNDAQ